MTKKTTNLLGIIITILAGIYFFVMYCSQCGLDDDFATLHNEDSSVVNNTMNPETIEKSKQEFLYKN
ncbi:hypothetical protein [uncultured Eudoraea sp.]|uniref:hypothetical protein n=1 Tax=uncultured Eudoraea sp. TaxID=1035614 RepID=UPI00262B79D5|nr:hypothetical protein [uncultured Eudoraea sp.]